MLDKFDKEIEIKKRKKIELSQNLQAILHLLNCITVLQVKSAQPWSKMLVCHGSFLVTRREGMFLENLML